MDTRIQTINDDTVLEVTEVVSQKTRYSEADLLRRKEYYEGMIAKCGAELAEVDALLANIQNEKGKI